MDYVYVLRRAWDITWRHAVLWLFGILATLSGRFPFSVGWRDLPPRLQAWAFEFFGSRTFLPAVVAFLVLAALLGLAMGLLHALGRAGMVHQVNRIENGGTPTAGTGWRAGKRQAWRVLAITLLLGLPAFLVTMAGLLPVMISAARELGRFDPGGLSALATQARLAGCFAPACCLGLLLAIPTRVLQRLAVRACVLELQPVAGSIVKAWHLLRDSPGAVGLLWLVLAAITAGCVVVVGIPLCLLLVAILAPVEFLLIAVPSLGLAGVCGAALLFWFLQTIAYGVLETFFSACWTVAYRDLTGAGRTGEEAAWA